MKPRRFLTLRRLWCRIAGHRWEGAALQYGEYWCSRCDTSVGPYDPSFWSLAYYLWSLKIWFRFRWQSLSGRAREWWRRKTDPNYDDDIPF